MKSNTGEITLVPEGFENKAEFYKAFLKAQSEFPDIPKSRTGARNIRYADLGDILRTIVPILHKHGICIEQDLTHNDQLAPCILTRLTHAQSGQGSESTLILPFKDEDFKGKNTFQVYGGAYTYFKRYALGSKLCLYFDEDTDGIVEERRQSNTVPKSNTTSGSNFF